jgi:hypothetical protein
MEKIINKLSSDLVFGILLYLGYFLAANFQRKIIMLSATGNFSKFLWKKNQRLDVVHQIKLE